MRVPYEELFRVLLRILLNEGFQSERAKLCARLFADSSRDGVYSHGLNRFPRFIHQIRNGVVKIHAQPQRVASFGALERWDGNQGPGNLNAHHCMDRAIALSRKNGVGCVALSNTNHWMRGGSYGWQAADAGVIAICWTNTMANLPPWGATEPRLGNNPLVIAVPRSKEHVVLDMALSQFSFGALESFRSRGSPLPVYGGFDRNGQLTNDPGAIEESGRPLPIGYWKGSGLAMMLDLMAALLSGGCATWQIPANPNAETSLSQVFIAIDIASIEDAAAREYTVNQIIDSIQGSPTQDLEKVRYPGRRTFQTRQENLELGIPVDPAVWRSVHEL